MRYIVSALFWLTVGILAIVLSPIIFIVVAYRAANGKSEFKNIPTLEEQVSKQHKRMRVELAQITKRNIPDSFEITGQVEKLIYDYQDAQCNLERATRSMKELL